MEVSMMTIEEKMEMYRNKKCFIDGLSRVFKECLNDSTIDKITYEVYYKPNDPKVFFEWLVVHFVGGGISPRHATGNSNSCNFRQLGKLLDGGYYDEVRTYESLQKFGFEQLILD
jgi:hypothetical protein